MEENEFRRTYDDVRELPCVFEKAILNRQCGCGAVERFSIGEREGVRCSTWTAARNCSTLLELLRANGRFALRLAEIPGPLPHAQELKLQVGGLQGLKQVVRPGSDEQVTDIQALVSAARAQAGSLAELPFGRIVQGIHAFQGRKRRRRPGRRPPTDKG
jgi:hypothetical protein